MGALPHYRPGWAEQPPALPVAAEEALTPDEGQRLSIARGLLAEAFTETRDPKVAAAGQIVDDILADREGDDPGPPGP